MNAPTITEAPIHNGNKFVSVAHLYVPHKGTFFATKEAAIKQGTSPNGVGLWVEEITHEGFTYFRAGNTNAWD